MPVFITALPKWVLVLGALALIYGLYRWYKYKKATAYAPPIVRGADHTLRENPPPVGGNGN